MKNLKLFSIFLVIGVLSSCVTTKKYNGLNEGYKALQKNDDNCNQNLKDAQASIDKLNQQNQDLQAQLNQQKKQLENSVNSSNELLTTLQDVSVLSKQQAESVKQSLATINERDMYIQGLHSALERKDSLNLELVTKLKGVIGNLNDQDINIKVEKGVVYIDISDKMLFNTGKYEVTKQAHEVLGKVAMVLNAYPSYDFMVEGNTDNVPIHTSCMEDNWDLSVKRATSVIRILQDDYKVNPARMVAAGHGKYNPIGTNDTAEGRAINRRTSIIILPQLDQFFKLLANK